MHHVRGARCADATGATPKSLTDCRWSGAGRPSLMNQRQGSRSPDRPSGLLPAAALQGHLRRPWAAAFRSRNRPNAGPASPLTELYLPETACRELLFAEHAPPSRVGFAQHRVDHLHGGRWSRSGNDARLRRIDVQDAEANVSNLPLGLAGSADDLQLVGEFPTRRGSRSDTDTNHVGVILHRRRANPMEKSELQDKARVEFAVARPSMLHPPLHPKD